MRKFINIKMIQDGWMSKAIKIKQEKHCLVALIGNEQVRFGGFSGYGYVSTGCSQLWEIEGALKYALDEMYYKEDTKAKYEYMYDYLCEHI